jgi:uncharacterized protein
MPARQDIVDLVNATPLVDTHEHLWGEPLRLQGLDDPATCLPPADFGMLLVHYCDHDLVTAGMPPEETRRLFSRELSPREKWDLFSPWYAKARNTGYLKAFRETLRILCGEEDLTAENCESVSAKVAAGIKPGFLRHLLKDVANIEYCQVNLVWGTKHPLPPFDETDQPDLLAQDLSTIQLSTGVDLSLAETLGCDEVRTLADWHGVIDRAFGVWGPRAIATKNQCAYGRRLDFDPVTAEDAAPLFERFVRDRDSLTWPEHKAVQDHLFHYCVRKAVEHNLTVKLHTGYYAGNNHMYLEKVAQNPADLCPLLAAHPDARFDLFHIGYPYQDEMIALAKHWHNAHIDMCWAWIVNPAASVRFLKEYLMAAPASKLLTFGGDMFNAEYVVGHAAMARHGITRALSELVDEGWLHEREVPALVERLMRGNAHELFDYEGTLSHWDRAAAPA